MQTPFPEFWVGHELHGLRAPIGSSTYYDYPLSLQPTVPSEVRDSIEWIFSKRNHLYTSDPESRYPEQPEIKVRNLQNTCIEQGFELPGTFVDFLSNQNLVDRVRSPAGCSFEIDERIYPGPDGNGYLHFLTDSQGVCFWHLYFGTVVPSVVSSFYLFSPEYLDFMVEDGTDLTEHLYISSHTFGEFLFRFWIESEIYFALHEGEEFDSDMTTYANKLRNAHND